MIRTHKIRLTPTSDQANYLARAAGTSRFVFNWGLGQWKRQAEALRWRRFESQKPLRMSLKQLVHASRALSQKQKCHTLHPELTLVARIFVSPKHASDYIPHLDYTPSL